MSELRSSFNLLPREQRVSSLLKQIAKTQSVQSLGACKSLLDNMRSINIFWYLLERGSTRVHVATLCEAISRLCVWRRAGLFDLDHDKSVASQAYKTLIDTFVLDDIDYEHADLWLEYVRAGGVQETLYEIRHHTSLEKPYQLDNSNAIKTHIDILICVYNGAKPCDELRHLLREVDVLAAVKPFLDSEYWYVLLLHTPSPFLS